MKFSTSSALLLSFLLLASMMVEPVQSTEIRIRENKNKQYDLPVPRTLKKQGKGGGTGGTGGKGGKGNSGNSGRCSKNEANNCIGDDPCDTDFDVTNSAREKTGVCNGDHACADMKYTNVDEFGCDKENSCLGVQYADICKSSCSGENACEKMTGTDTNHLQVNPGACNGSFVCRNLAGVSKIGSGACQREKACDNFEGNGAPDLTIGTNSCVGTRSCNDYKGGSIGNDSCVGNQVCKLYTGSSIGDNACVDPTGQVCNSCTFAVGDNECNVNYTPYICPC